MHWLKTVGLGLLIPTIYIVVYSVSAYKHSYAFPGIMILAFLLSVYLKRGALKHHSRFASLLILNWLLGVLMVISTFTGGFPLNIVYLFSILLVSYLGLIFTSSSYKAALIVALVVISGVGAGYLMPATYFLYQNRNAYVDFDHPDLWFFADNYDTVRVNPDVVTVLDNWHVFCGPCFKKFPELNKLYLEYKDHPGVEIYALNSPQRLDHPDSVRAHMHRLNYDFPVLYAPGTKVVQDAFQFNGYPHLVILKNGKVHYSGLFATAWNQPFADPRNVIEKLLAETEQ